MIDTNTTRNLKTVDEWKAYFREMIPQLNPNWTNTSDEDLGMVLVTLISIIGDQLNFRFDMSMLEAFLTSARERNNVQGILNLIGYKLKGYRTSKTEVTLKYPEESAAPFESDYIIPRFSYVINSKNPNIKYYTLEPLNIFSGALGITSEFYEGDYLNDVKTTNQVDSLGRLYLTEVGKNIAENAVVVTYDNTIVLKRVDDIYLSTEPYTYQLLLDNYGRYYIQFDSSWKTYINKSAPLIINIEFLVTSGASSQVRADFLNTLIGGTGPAALEINNNEAAYGYQDPESVEQARLNGPRYARTMNTAVTTQDFEDLILLMDSNFLDASAVDLNYNGMPINFTTLKSLKLLLMSLASDTFDTLPLEYIFTAMEEIKSSDLTNPTTLANLKAKYEVTGILGLETVEATKSKILSYDYLDVLQNIAENTVNVALNPLPTPVTTWVSGRAYRVNDSVVFNDTIYICLTEHNSTSFIADLANWQMLDNENEYSQLFDVLGIDLINAFKNLDLFVLDDLIQEAVADMVEKNILDLLPYELIIAVLTPDLILSDFQKEQISKVLDANRLATLKYELVSPEVVNLDVYLTAYVSSRASSNSNIKSILENLVTTYVNSLKIGESFRLSQLIAYIHSNYPIEGLIYLVPNTETVVGTTVNTLSASKLQIIRTLVKVPSVLNIEIKNI
jgi:hypothetical protein